MDRLNSHRGNQRPLPRAEYGSSAQDHSFRRMAGNVDPAMAAQVQRNQELINEFHERRSAAARNAKAFSKLGGSTSMGGDVLGAIPRFYDPMEYWEFSQLPWDIGRDDHRLRLYQWLSMFYNTHHLVPILVDIFTRFPLVGMEFHCKDDKLSDYYKELFFNRLDYEQFLVDLGKEYWLYGQSFPLGSFNETLGLWDREELVDPALVQVDHFPIVGNTQMNIVPHPVLVDIARTQAPREAWWKLKTEYPDLIPYLMQNKPYPVSDVLLKQVAFKVSPRDKYGTPILLRGLRTLIHEEKLMASQDAIAERLYSPMILAKLGMPDLGDQEGPWIPTQEELGAFRDDIDIALASDFRLLVHHFAVDIQNVFGREQMPRLDSDFDRIERNIMQVFGVNQSLLSGGDNTQPYASSALQAEFLNQILRTFQGYLKKHVHERMLAVAEAQEHYDYEMRGDTRIPIMEEVIEYDEEGVPHLVERNKLLVPELRMKVLDLRDEATQRNFLQQLKAEGVPVPDSEMAMGMNFDFEEFLNKTQEELVAKTVAQQEAKVKTYKILVARGLPIPPDLKAEVEGLGSGGEMGQGGPLMNSVNAPAPGDLVMPPPPELGGGLGGSGVPGMSEDAAGQGLPPAMGPNSPMRGTVPEQSNERTPLMSPGGLTSPGGPNAPAGPNGRPRNSRISKTEEEIAHMADHHRPEGGYGEVSWNPDTKTVFWVSADWSSNDEIENAEQDFLAIPGVEHFEHEAEAAAPEGDGWVRLS